MEMVYEKVKLFRKQMEILIPEGFKDICRLDFIESILRRGAKGIKLAELKVE